MYPKLDLMWTVEGGGKGYRVVATGLMQLGASVGHQNAAVQLRHPAGRVVIVIRACNGVKPSLTTEIDKEDCSCLFDENFYAVATVVERWVLTRFFAQLFQLLRSAFSTIGELSMSKTKTLKIAVFAIFSMAIATFATQPAQAKRGLLAGYKYVAVQNTLDYGAHVVQLDFLWTIKGGGKGYRDGGKRPYQVFGFGLAVAANSTNAISSSQLIDSSGTPLVDDLGNELFGEVTVKGRNVYFALPLIYEYVFDFGLGISGGVTIPIMATLDEGKFGAGTGIGISDFGLSYHFNNGLTLYTRTNIGYAVFFGGDLSDEGESVGGKNGVMWGAGGGIGYWF